MNHSLPSFAQVFLDRDLPPINSRNLLPPIHSRPNSADSPSSKKRSHLQFEADSPILRPLASPPNLNIKQEQDDHHSPQVPPPPIHPSPLKKRRVTISGAPPPLNTDLHFSPEQPSSTPISPVVIGMNTIMRDNPSAVEKVRSMITVKQKQKAIIEQRRGSVVSAASPSVQQHDVPSGPGTPRQPRRSPNSNSTSNSNHSSSASVAPAAPRRAHNTHPTSPSPPPPQLPTPTSAAHAQNPVPIPQSQAQSQPQTSSHHHAQPPSSHAPHTLATPNSSSSAPAAQSTHSLPPPPNSFARRRAAQFGGKKKPADILISPRDAQLQHQPSVQSAPLITRAGWPGNPYQIQGPQVHTPTMAIPRLPLAMAGGSGENIRHVKSSVPPTPTRLSMQRPSGTAGTAGSGAGTTNGLSGNNGLGGVGNISISGATTSSGRSPPASVPIASTLVPQTPTSLVPQTRYTTGPNSNDPRTPTLPNQQSLGVPQRISAVPPSPLSAAHGPSAYTPYIHVSPPTHGSHLNPPVQIRTPTLPSNVSRMGASTEADEKSAFMAPFEIFFDALRDARQLKLWLADQVARAGALHDRLEKMAGVGKQTDQQAGNSNDKDEQMDAEAESKTGTRTEPGETESAMAVESTGTTAERNEEDRRLERMIEESIHRRIGQRIEERIQAEINQHVEARVGKVLEEVIGLRRRVEELEVAGKAPDADKVKDKGEGETTDAPNSGKANEDEEMTSPKPSLKQVDEGRPHSCSAPASPPPSTATPGEVKSLDPPSQNSTYNPSGQESYTFPPVRRDLGRENERDRREGSLNRSADRVINSGREREKEYMEHGQVRDRGKEDYGYASRGAQHPHSQRRREWEYERERERRPRSLTPPDIGRRTSSGSLPMNTRSPARRPPAGSGDVNSSGQGAKRGRADVLDNRRDRGRSVETGPGGRRRRGQSPTKCDVGGG